MKRLLALAALVTIGATSPPRFSVVPTSVQETAGSVSVEIDKSAKASSYSKITVTTVDGTAKVGLDYKAVNTSITVGNNTLRSFVSVPIIARSGYQGPRAFTVHIAVTRNGTVAVSNATVSIAETEQPPAPVPVPTPVPTPAPTWVSAPLRDGGYARCKAVGGCHSIAYPCFAGTTPPNCSYPDIIAQQGDVMMYAWNGCDAGNPCRAIGAFWPIGQYKTSTPYIGVEGWVDEWEGVAPAAGSIVGSLVTRLGLVYRVVSSEPDQIIPGTIVGVQYVSDTTGHYYLASDPVLKAETQYFGGSDLTPVP